MIILTKGNKTASMSFGIMEAKADSELKDVVYTVTAPTIACNNESDAVRIKDELNRHMYDFISNLVSEE